MCPLLTVSCWHSLARKVKIEQRKEEAERAMQERERDEEMKKLMAERLTAEAEEKRREEERYVCVVHWWCTLYVQSSRCLSIVFMLCMSEYNVIRDRLSQILLCCH